MNKRVTLILLIIFVLLPIKSFGTVDLQEVAIVSTFGSWNMRMIESIRNESRDVNLRLKLLSSGDVDHFDNWHEELELFKEEISKNPPKAIILIGDECWIVFKEIIEKEEFSIPIILCGVKEYTMKYKDLIKLGSSEGLNNFIPLEETLKGLNAYAVIEPVEVKNVYHMMVKVNPEMDKVALLTRSKYYGSYVQFITKKFFEENYPHIKTKFYKSNEYTTQQMADELKAMDRKTGVAFSSWGSRRTDTIKSIDNTYKLFGFFTPSPPFMVGFNKRSINHVLGGDFPNSEQTATETMRVLLKLLSGDRIESKIINPTKRVLHINAEAMNLWSIPESLLPEDVVIYNQSSSFLQKYSNYIWSILIIILTVIIVVLEDHKKKVRYRRELEKKNRLLEKANQIADNERKRAEEATKMKSIFLANMSHEIKTPLNAIVGFSNLITNENIDSDEKKEICKIIDKNSQIVNSLISDLLDLSRIESGVVNIELKPIDLKTIIDRCYFSQQINWSSNAKFTKEIPNTVVTVLADEIRLQQVIHNLISNAQKHTSSGEVTLGYRVDDDHSVIIYVNDTGAGIPEEHIHDIFNRFFKATTKVQGTGLGLTISKTLVEKMKGKIWVESTIGKGSIFYFSIPTTSNYSKIAQPEVFKYESENALTSCIS
ncbi:MAG: sensor histidine kinase [Bacteroidales bacterium]